MNRGWEDLYALTDEPPRWYGREGVPRWCEFKDGLGIYWRIAVLVRIACQACGARFPVGVEFDQMDLLVKPASVAWPPSTRERYPGPARFLSVDEAVALATVSWGDPPAHGCVGDTMSSDFIEVLEIWHRPDGEAVQVR